MENHLHCVGTFIAPLPVAIKELKKFLETAHKENIGVMDISVPNSELSFVFTDLDGIEKIAEKICELQVRYKLRDPWTLTWAETKRELGFQSGEGGAVVCYRGKSQWLTSDDWIDYATQNLKMQFS